MMHIGMAIGIILFLVSTLLSNIPFVKTYSIPGQFAGVILIGVSAFFFGKADYKSEVDKQISDLKTQLANAKVQSSNVNTNIEADNAEKIQIIHDKGQTVIKYIQANSDTMDKDCKVDQSFIDAYNNAATVYNKLPGITGKDSEQ